MKRLTCLCVVLLMVFSLTGCMTQRQLDAEKYYYDHIKALSAAQESKPIFKLTPAKPGDPILIENLGAIEVFSPPQPVTDYAKQYQHRDFTPSWVPAALNAFAPLGFLYGSSILVKEVGKATGSTTYNQNIDGTGNTATIKQAGNTSLSGGLSGNSNQIGGMIDNTADPTVVKVDPFVIEPTIVTTPLIGGEL